MVKLKLSRPPEGNESKILTDFNKGQSLKPKKYSLKNRNKPILEPKSKTNFQGWCTDLEGNIIYLGPRAYDKFTEK